MAGAKPIQTVRHAMTLAYGADVKLKKYEDLNDDYPSVMQVTTISQIDPVVMAIQGQGTQVGNQYPNRNVARLNWKANLTCYKCVEKENLARECPHTGNAAVSKTQSTQTVNTLSRLTLLPVTNPKLSQKIIAKTSVSVELWPILMDQPNKAN